LLSSSQENIDIKAESVLLYIFSRLSVNGMKQNDILQKIIDFTESNFDDPELSLASVAREIGYNAKYLSHFFKTKMHLNYSEYLRSIRFKHAVLLFENGISSIKNVSFLCGFSDPLYFSNAFKKEMGYSPKEFIATLSKDSPD
jgi:two-component system response regulator YesN